MSRKNIPSASKWEDEVGYSRAVRVGNVIEVSGTTATSGDEVVGDNVYDQTVFVIQKIERALKQAGASLKDVVRTRIYVVNIDDWQMVAKAHKQFFAEVKPAASMLQIAKLIDARLLVEIEATAVVNP